MTAIAEPAVVKSEADEPGTADPASGIVPGRLALTSY